MDLWAAIARAATACSVFAFLTGCASAPPSSAAPTLTCADVGGVFVAHGTDGRGDCEPADPRPKCHVPPADQDANYLAGLTMMPPFPNGTLDPWMTPSMIQNASNKDCWKQPAYPS
ncbi:hypothetical protein MFM001_24510 [Mycobacterium sp. MFM001]|uniref:hypothetical protein n=1 Tax=Mycobacterium sp. MFM001 TaxID=2049453 RepID=UPI000DA4962D|nr:hypothetical protein [Mycobacterium sp. MFM001]GBE65989.1 hypothetical protein MFM001_24510 [Mycobacterium sp. MFM001]